MPLTISNAQTIPSGSMWLGGGGNRADAIVVGDVMRTAISDWDDVGGAEIELALRVDHTIKGTELPGANIAIRYRETAVNKNRVMFPRHGIATSAGRSFDYLLDPPKGDVDWHVLALLRNASDSYTFALPSCSTMRVSSVDSVGYIQSNDVSANLQSEIRNSLLSLSNDIVLEALEQTYILNRADLSAVTLPLVSSSDLNVRMSAMAACLRGGELSVLPGAVDLLLAHDTPNDGEPQQNIGTGLLRLESAIAGAKVDANCTPVIAKALSARNYRFRRVAVDALRLSKDRTALPYLKAALNDTSPEIRYDAMQGLAVILNDKTPIPLYLVYTSNPDAYADCLNYWKARSLE
jgi:hypothetical protein